MTKSLRFLFCLLAVSWLTGDSRAQETSEKKSDVKADRKEPAVPEKIVSEKQAIEQLVGSYRVVSGEKSGEQILPERLADVTVRITEKTITTYDGDRQQRFSATYRLDTAQRPWRVRMIPVAAANKAAASQAAPAADPNTSPSDGLIEVTEKGAKVVYALPTGEMPRSFKAAARQQLFILERLKDQPEAATAAPASPNAPEGTKSDK